MACASGNPTCFTFTDALNTEKSLNWWNCYNVDSTYEGRGKLAWIPTVAAVDFARSKGKSKGVNGANIPTMDELRQLMKLVPYGRVDGMIKSSFPTNAEMYGFLMRSVGIEEALIQEALIKEYGNQGEATYLASQGTRNEVDKIKNDFLNFVNQYGYDTAMQVWNSVGTQGSTIDQLARLKAGMSGYSQNNSSLTSRAITPKRDFMTPVKRMRRTLNAPNVNTNQPVHPLAFIAVPLAVVLIIRGALTS